jgi:hypothetical protein
MSKSLISLDDRRPLGIALAHELMKCKVGRDHARLAILNRLFSGSNSRVRIMCRVEFDRCRKAVRGELLAAVS